ncbi:hypothetical protein Taro_021365, partial [Colocasia esculenta]|nr:hypothetical protein [Colocasia esculenta]
LLVAPSCAAAADRRGQRAKRKTEEVKNATAGFLRRKPPAELAGDNMDGEDDGLGTMVDAEAATANGGAGKATISSEQMDVEAYAGLYSGRTKVTRLMFVADRCGNPGMEIEALRMAYDEIRKGENTQLYREVVQKIGGRLGPRYEMDQAWTDAVDRRAELRKEKLENELNGYRVLRFRLFSLSHPFT